jgi:hypothetical protein
MSIRKAERANTINTTQAINSLVSENVSFKITKV